MRLIVLVTVLQSLNGVLSVLTCPFGERGWKSREKNFNCTEGHGLTYHCLLDLSGRPVEVCLKRREYREEGCPWVLQTDEGTFLGEPMTACENERYCPSSSKRFYSNQLYLHPACLVKKEERPNFTLPHIFFYDNDNSITSASPDQKSLRHESYFKAHFYVTIAISIFLLLLSVGTVICIIHISKGIIETETKYRRYQQQIDTRSLLNSTGKRDNPGKGRDIENQSNWFEMKSSPESIPDL